MAQQTPQQQTDLLSVESALLAGASKNFSNIILTSYYSEKKLVSERLLDARLDRLTIISLTRRLLEFVPEESRYEELLAEFEALEHKFLEQRAKYLKLDVPGKLSDSEKIECARKASEIIRYKVQLEVNAAHNLVRQRGIGVGFPWGAYGQSMFPLSEIPPDGEYVHAVTGRKYNFRLRRILTRKNVAAEPLPDEEATDDLGLQ